MDFICYSISEESIKKFIEKLNCINGIRLRIVYTIEELKHRDYKGKRIWNLLQKFDIEVCETRR